MEHPTSQPRLGAAPPGPGAALAFDGAAATAVATRLVAAGAPLRAAPPPMSAVLAAALGPVGSSFTTRALRALAGHATEVADVGDRLTGVSGALRAVAVDYAGTDSGTAHTVRAAS